MDLFKEKKVLPMLLHVSEVFDSDEYIYEIKFDGYRAIIYLDKDKINIRSRRNKDITYLYPELKDIYRCCNKKCILDGEIVVMDDNGPNFFKMQKRSQMTNKNKIMNESINNPVCFIVFDILYYDNKDLTAMPLMKRKEYLTKYIKENDDIVISKYIEKEGTKLFNEIKKKELEGIVAKEKNSIYEIGKRSHAWLKMKVVKEDDFYILGFKEEDNIIKTVVIANYEKDKLVLYGEVNLPNKYHQERVRKFSKNNTIKKAYFDMKNITWLKVKLKCSVRYKEITKNKSLRHAVFLKFVD